MTGSRQGTGGGPDRPLRTVPTDIGGESTVSKIKIENGTKVLTEVVGGHGLGHRLGNGQGINGVRGLGLYQGIEDDHEHLKEGETSIIRKLINIHVLIRLLNIIINAC